MNVYETVDKYDTKEKAKAIFSRSFVLSSQKNWLPAPVALSHKFLNTVRLTTPTYPPPSRGEEINGIPNTPLLLVGGARGGGPKDYGNLFPGHDTKCKLH
jgi:hypothetical protein